MPSYKHNKLKLGFKLVVAVITKVKNPFTLIAIVGAFLRFE
ncbi:MAG TPA: hypothetical protein PLX53_02865 [Tenuifilaceae bacterium]|nr:hypothetical protein [Tenuifilaceae bacterium]